eukprot:1161966-Pelagomonas_calceolata.AAC.8
MGKKLPASSTQQERRCSWVSGCERPASCQYPDYVRPASCTKREDTPGHARDAAGAQVTV